MLRKRLKVYITQTPRTSDTWLDISHFDQDDALQFIRENKISVRYTRRCSIYFSRKIDIEITGPTRIRLYRPENKWRSGETREQFNARFQANSKYNIERAYTIPNQHKPIDVMDFAMYHTYNMTSVTGMCEYCFKKIICNEFTNTMLSLTYPELCRYFTCDRNDDTIRNENKETT